MHIPVLIDPIERIIKNLSLNIITDCTFGAGGHSKLFDKYCNNLIALDRDQITESFTQDYNWKNFSFFNDKFSNIDKYIDNSDLIFADLGMSSMQLDSNRGFSFMSDSELDMRMGDDVPLKLKHILKKMPIFKIKEIIQTFGEEPNATKIANNIDRYRLHKDIVTTKDLREAIGIDKYSILARVFQAFRMFINNETTELEILLSKIIKLTNFSLIITFHSIEDRLVKHCFKKNFKYSGYIQPSEEEITFNPKSRSAKLRFGSNFLINYN